MTFRLTAPPRFFPLPHLGSTGHRGALMRGGEVVATLMTKHDRYSEEQVREHSHACRFHHLLEADRERLSTRRA